MGQSEALKILKKARKWMLIKEIAEANGNGSSSMTCNLNKLFEQGLVERKQIINLIGHPLVYRIKK